MASVLAHGATVARAAAPARAVNARNSVNRVFCARPAARVQLRAGARTVAAAAEPYKAALLFDCDGVIVETEEMHRLAYNGAFEHFGLKIDGEPVVWSVPYYDVLQNTVGGGKPKMRWHFTENGWPEGAPADEEGRTKLIDDLQDKKTEVYKELVVTVAKPRPGVLELMDEALDRPDLGVAICSAATKAGFEKVVNAIVGPERLARFDLILAGDDVPKKKPDPLIYNLARERLGVDADKCLVIEDSIVGLRAAMGANMNCVITATSSTRDQPMMDEGATAVVDCLVSEDGERITIDDLFNEDTEVDVRIKEDVLVVVGA